MRSLHVLRLCLLAGLMQLGTAAQAADDFVWPPDIDRQLDRVVQLQRDARLARWAPRDDVTTIDCLRHEFDHALLALGSSPELIHRIPQLQPHEGQDIRAKLACIARDFALNRAAYEIIEAHYVLYPRTHWEYWRYEFVRNPHRLVDFNPNLRPHVYQVSFLGPNGSHPSLRLAFEYHLLAPRLMVLTDGWSCLVSSLAAIGHPATQLTYLELSTSCLLDIRHGEEVLVNHVIQGLCDYPSRASLEALHHITSFLPSKLPDEAGPDTLQKTALCYIGGTWGHWGLGRECFERDARNYARWQSLVADVLKDETHQPWHPLAKAIATLPPPPPFPGPDRGDPFARRSQPFTALPPPKPNNSSDNTPLITEPAPELVGPAAPLRLSQDSDLGLSIDPDDPFDRERTSLKIETITAALPFNPFAPGN
ncbi:MAG: hypothetical protein V4662_04565 [Verrucomicrobiota bacterium]